MKKTLSVLILLAAAAWGQTPEYLPLQSGNQWVYRATLGPQLVLTVERQETVNGHVYAVLAGSGAATLTGAAPESWLRYAAPGVLVRYDLETKTERPYLDFTAAEGVSFPTSAHPCNSTAALESHAFKGSYSLGDFTNVTRVRYGTNSCADAGLTADDYLPYIGLLRRTETSFTGPRSYDLIYARINGTVMVSTPETSLTLSTDKPLYVNATDQAPVAEVRMSLRHFGPDPLILEFATGQETDYILTDSAGQKVYQWSDGQVFTQALKTLRIAGEQNWAVRIPLRTADGQVLRGGSYRLEGLVTTIGGPRYRSQVTIEVAEIRPAQP